MATNTAASLTTHTGNGSTNAFSISFSFLADNEIDVTVAGVTKTLGTHYTISGSTITFTSGNTPANGAAIKFQRDTDISAKKVDFSDGSVLTEADLDANSDQIIFAQQEITDKLAGIEEGATADQTDAEIRTAVENASDSNVFTDADHTKLNNIEANATQDQTASEIRALVESASDSNVFTDADHSKLNGIESGATSDQTAAEIRTLVESASDSNVFTDSDHTKLNNAVTLTDTQTLTNKTLTTPVINDLSGSAVVTSGTSTSDNKVYSAKRAGEIFYGKDTVEEIQSGETWSSADNKVATTAAIDARIIDLIDDVGGFDIIANEQSFPNTNPQGTTGQAAVISIKAVTTNLVPSGTTVTIANGNLANNQNITITGVTSTIPSGFGVLVESTSTTHTYSFHRLVPKATEVTTVASKATEIGRLGTADAVADMAILGTADVVADMNTLGTADVVSDMNTLATTDVVNDMNTLAVSSVLNNMDTVVTNLSNVNNVGTNIAKVNSVAAVVGGTQTFTVTVQNVSGSNYFFIDGQQAPTLTLARGFTYTFDVSDSSNSGHPLRFKDGSGNSYTTGVTANGTQGQSGATVVIAVAANAPSSLRYYCTVHGNGMGNTITVTDDNIGTVAGSIANVNTTAGSISNVNTVGNSISNVNTVASNISSVNSFFNTYRIGSSNPTSSLDVGDLFFNTSTNSLKVYTGSAWVDGVTTTGNFALKTGNTFTGNNLHNDNVKSIYGTGSDLEIFHDGSNSFIKDTGDGVLALVTNFLAVNNAADNEHMIKAFENGAVELYYDNGKKFETTSSGNKATGKLALDDGTGISGNYLALGASDDLKIFHDGNDSYIKHAGGGNLRIETTGGTDEDIFLDSNDDIFLQVADGFDAVKCIGGGAVELYYDGSKKLETYASGVFVPDSANLAAGNAQDIKIRHDGSNSFFQNDTGNLLIQAKAGFNCLNLITSSNGGHVELYHDNSKKFETTSGGVNVTGSLTVNGSAINTDLVSDTSPQLGGDLDCNGNEILLDDNTAVKIGDSSDLRLFHNGTDSEIKSFTGKLYVFSDELFLASFAAGEPYFKGTSNGAAELYYNSSKKFETTANGVKVPDAARIAVGDSEDAYFYHNGAGSDGAISNTVGNFLIYGGNGHIYLRPVNTENSLIAYPNGTVSLYYDANKKFETTSVGIQVSGRVYAKAQSLTSSLVGQFDPSVFDVNGSAQSTETVAIKSQKNDCLDLTRYYTAGTIQTFRFNNDFTGSITTGTTAVAYNTSSDYRLKENAIAISDGITRLKQLKPYKFNFKTEPTVVHDGFFAHEVTPIVPTAVSGEKDATEIRYYEKGDILPSGKVIGDVKDENAIIPQSLDHSKLVPLLVAAVQELIGKVEALEAA